MKINYRTKKTPAGTTVKDLVIWYISEVICKVSSLEILINLKIISKDNETIIDWDTLFNFNNKFLKAIPPHPIINELVFSNIVDEDPESLSKNVVIKIDKTYVEYMMS